MRFIGTPTVTFTDDRGNSYNIYDFRKIPKYETARTLNRFSGEDFDEIFSRRDIAGEGMEAQSFQLHEANIQEILDANFNYDKIRSVKIPRVNA